MMNSGKLLKWKMKWAGRKEKVRKQIYFGVFNYSEAQSKTDVFEGFLMDQSESLEGITSFFFQV